MIRQKEGGDGEFLSVSWECQSFNKELFWPMPGTIGKVGREIRIGRRRKGRVRDSPLQPPKRKEPCKEHR